MLEVTFAIFAIAALLLFRFIAPERAVAITCFAGWLILPIGHFPAGSADAAFPYWLTGVAVPSDMLITKMWWPPICALAGVTLVDRKVLARWRPAWIDIPMILWCLWPIGQWPFIEQPSPQPWIASLYLTGAWGAPWLLGRLYFSGDDGGLRLIRAVVAGLVLIAPIALLEGISGPWLYDWSYDLHPFNDDGTGRYIGFRPLGFFEHGNQYGFWVAAVALAAIWLWWTAPSSPIRFRFFLVATLGLAIALISQSVGAILMLIAGLALFWAIGRPLARSLLIFVFLLTIAGGVIYLSGTLPIQKLAKETIIGRRVVNLVRNAGRQSMTWRIARDQRALTLTSKHRLVGTAKWDWWRQNGERPWGLALLIFGQFGLIGLMLAFGALLVPALRALNNQWNSSAWRGNSSAAPLAIIVLMASADALLNSFFFYPAILAAGAIASNKVESTRLVRSERFG